MAAKKHDKDFPARLFVAKHDVEGASHVGSVNGASVFDDVSEPHRLAVYQLVDVSTYTFHESVRKVRATRQKRGKGRKAP